ncbi:hypothetical protein [Parvularcula maris]|uniref:Uncharacterized protein n=1 Tax=Parvularcula maris TaxID=2965077 RepID=A0A9X2L9V6_9PROT|nr:hypothetical protein [Parvularcula maris]MCQ8185712.1 hypothetical protein [Parvularcula maris]
MTGTKTKAGAAAGAVGVLAVAGTLFFGGDDEVPEASDVIAEEREVLTEAPVVRPEMTEASAETSMRFCSPAVLGGDGCAEAEAVAGQVQGLFRAEAMPNRTLTLISGEDGTEDEATDCQRFAELRRAGYGAKTGGDMAREAQLARVCGLVLMAGRAQPAEGPPPGQGLFSVIPRAELPSLGEAVFDADAVIVIESESPLIWSIEDSDLRGEFVHVGTADFDGDPGAEYLIEWRLQSVGGSARAIGYGLAEGTPPSFRTVDPFAAG